MDVHPPKNGVNRYWSIAISSRNRFVKNRVITRNHWKSLRWHQCICEGEPQLQTTHDNTYHQTAHIIRQSRLPTGPMMMHLGCSNLSWPFLESLQYGSKEEPLSYETAWKLFIKINAIHISIPANPANRQNQQPGNPANRQPGNPAPPATPP